LGAPTGAPHHDRAQATWGRLPDLGRTPDPRGDRARRVRQPPGRRQAIADLDKPHDELWWVKQKLRHEHLSYLSATLLLRKEAEDALVAASQAGSGGPGAADRDGDQQQDREGNRKAASGPPLNLMPFDVERVVRDWHKRQASPW
jgi:hypothetical protein